MWELIVMLEENKDVYFCYTFEHLGSLMDWVTHNEKHNADHCVYSVERISRED